VDLNGSWCEDPGKVREEVRKVFVKLFSTPKYFSFNLQNIDFPTVSNEENMLLMKDINDQEIKKVLNECGATKSPSPDAFNFLFLKHNWDTMTTNVCQAVSWSFWEGKIPKGCNVSFIALVPK